MYSPDLSKPYMTMRSVQRVGPFDVVEGRGELMGEQLIVYGQHRRLPRVVGCEGILKVVLGGEPGLTSPRSRNAG